MQRERIEIYRHPTPLGAVTVAASVRGVVRVLFPGADDEDLLTPLLRRYPDLQLIQLGEPSAWLVPAVNAIERALTGADIELPALDLDSSDFERAVLRSIRRIPRGQTRSYREVAEDVGRPQASRAVGQACSGNPVPILVPCHRVVGHRGDLVGFGGGTEMKVRLLAAEGVLLT